MKKFLLVIVLCLLGCDTQQQRVQGFVYIKDSRTQLCFATFNLGYNTGIATNVPCTVEVESAVEQDKKQANTER